MANSNFHNDAIHILKYCLANVFLNLLDIMADFKKMPKVESLFENRIKSNELSKNGFGIKWLV